MPRPRNRLTDANPFLAWTKLALHTGEMLTASAQVIHHRSGRIAAAGILPDARDRREFRLMGQEKIEAAAESMQAMAVQIANINLQMANAVLRQWISGAGMFALLTSPVAALSARRQGALLRTAMTDSTALASQAAGSLARLAHHGMRPIHARATGNARRLLKD